MTRFLDWVVALVVVFVITGANWLALEIMLERGAF